MVSTGAPLVTGPPDQPRKPEVKLSSATLEPMPVVWVDASTLRALMAPLASNATYTVTSLPE